RNGPMDCMGFSFVQKIKAWLIFLPCLLMALNVLGYPLSIWAAVSWINGAGILPEWGLYWGAVNIGLYAVFMAMLYRRVWVRTLVIMDNTWKRIRYMLRVHPLCLGFWWTFWAISLWIGYRMYPKNLGLVLGRTLE